MTTETCPISPEVVDDHAIRIGAGLTILVTAATLYFRSGWIALALGLDFALRSRGLAAASPVAQAAKALRKLSGLRPAPINAGPKRFAALVGAVFSLVIAAALFLHLIGVALAAAAVLILCAALEAFLGYCVGCKVYGLFYRHSVPAEAAPASDPVAPSPQ